jgi:hypothetical protein
MAALQDEPSAFFTPKALDAMQRAVSQAIAEHHRLGHPVAIWQDGRVVHLYPDGTTRPIDKPQTAIEPAA